MNRIVLLYCSVGGGSMGKCKCCSLFIAIYPAVTSYVFVMPLRDHCFPRTALPQMLIGVKLCTLTWVLTSLSMAFEQWNHIGADRNWRDNCRFKLGIVVCRLFFSYTSCISLHFFMIHNDTIKLIHNWGDCWWSQLYVVELSGVEGSVLWCWEGVVIRRPR